MITPELLVLIQEAVEGERAYLSELSHVRMGFNGADAATAEAKAGIRRHLDAAHMELLEVVIAAVKRHGRGEIPAFDLAESVGRVVQAFAHVQLALELSERGA